MRLVCKQAILLIVFLSLLLIFIAPVQADKPSPRPSPSPTPAPTPTASPTPSPTATPLPNPTPSHTPAPTPSPTSPPTPAPTPTPTPKPTITPSPTPGPTASPTPSPNPSPTPNKNSVSLLLTGIILYPPPSPTPTVAPSPTPKPTAINLEPLSAWYHIGDSSPSPLDYTVTHNGNPSIKCTPTIRNDIDETDGTWRKIVPNDHLVLEAWAKTENWLGATDINAGSWLGWDFYISGSVNGVSCSGIAILDAGTELQAGHPQQEELSAGGNPAYSFGYSIDGAGGLSQVNGNIIRTPFNTDWTLLKWDFYVPSRTFDYIWTDVAGTQPGGIYKLDAPVQISGIIPWMGVHDYPNFGHSVWYSEPALYINP